MSATDQNGQPAHWRWKFWQPGKNMHKPSPELTFLRCSFNTGVNTVLSEGGSTLREYPISEEFLTCEYKKIDLQRRYEL